MNILHTLPLLFALLSISILGSSCVTAPTITPEEYRTKMGNIRINPIEVAPDALQVPDGSNTQKLDRGLFRTRFIPGLGLPSLVASNIAKAGVRGGQQEDFEERYKHTFATLNSYLNPEDLGRRMEGALARRLNQTVMSGRVNRPGEAPSQVEGGLVATGFWRMGLDEDDQVILSPYITANASMTYPYLPFSRANRGDFMFIRPSHARTASYWVNNPAQARRAVDAIIDDYARRLATAVWVKDENGNIRPSDSEDVPGFYNVDWKNPSGPLASEGYFVAPENEWPPGD